MHEIKPLLNTTIAMFSQALSCACAKQVTGNETDNETEQSLINLNGSSRH